jgi:Predicted site-specific integrase-resolvase
MSELCQTDGWPVFMRPKMAAKYLGISEATLYRWVKEGKLVQPLQVSVGIRGWPQLELKRFADRYFVRQEEM